MPKHTVEIDYTNWRGERALAKDRRSYIEWNG